MLNNSFYPGPLLSTEPLFAIIFRFRTNHTAFIFDTEKAFLQINLDELDRDYVRFIYFEHFDNSVDNSTGKSLFVSTLHSFAWYYLITVSTI